MSLLTLAQGVTRAIDPKRLFDWILAACAEIEAIETSIAGITVPQSGTTTLVNGVSPAIVANVSAQSVIVATCKTVSGAQGNITALAADRVNGTPGSFKLTSVDPSTGATIATDDGGYDYIVLTP